VLNQVPGATRGSSNHPVFWAAKVVLDYRVLTGFLFYTFRFIVSDILCLPTSLKYLPAKGKILRKVL